MGVDHLPPCTGFLESEAPPKYVIRVHISNYSPFGILEGLSDRLKLTCTHATFTLAFISAPEALDTLRISALLKVSGS